MPGPYWRVISLVAVTARFRILYIFVVMEIGSRRILHCNVTDVRNNPLRVIDPTGAHLVNCSLRLFGFYGLFRYIRYN